ncbi:MAG: apolipoprotein N-acyltransferase [Deltaproteobacteria bacterium]|jgi:apolipoprotein N-acyltransferase|nr:apolipoprotein N-acyltransferase [Deltaproteobacteria bacterium]
MPNIRLRWRILLTAASSVLYFLAFVGFDQWYLAWICLVPLLFALEGLTPKKGFLLGWLFGIIALTGGFYWVAYTIHVFAFMPWFASGIGCVLLSLLQGTEFALFALLYTWLRQRTKLSPVLIGTIAFVAAEFISPQLFPHYFGASQYLQLKLIQISDITGVIGVTALIALVNTAIYQATSSYIFDKTIKWKPVLTVSVLIAAALIYGHFRIKSIDSDTSEYPSLRFGITQVNLGIREKSLNPAKARRLNQEQTIILKEAGADIVIWPETAIKQPILKEGQTKLQEIITGDIHIPIMTGEFLEGRGKPSPIYNIAVLADEYGDILGIYKKQKLLMMGEYIPFGNTFPILYDWMPYVSHMTPGDSYQPLKFKGHSLSVNICYEEILPRFIGKMMKYNPNVMVNITNDNWFGKTSEPKQHLALSIFRSVENRRWLVRSTNTGISAFVDATGRIVQQTPLMEPAMLIQDVPMLKGRTIYMIFGDWLGWLSLFSIAAVTLTKRRSSHL